MTTPPPAWMRIDGPTPGPTKIQHTNQHYTLTSYPCGHFYMKITGTKRAHKIKARKYAYMLKQHHENRYQNSLPYVTVTHKTTGKAFCLNRNYQLIATRYCAHMVQQWDKWAPTMDSQRPAWAQGLFDSEFHAVWHYK